MTIATGTTQLGVLLRAGQVLASAVPAHRSVPEALGLLGGLVAASGGTICDPAGAALAAYGEVHADGQHRIDVPLHAAGERHGVLAVWRDRPFELSEEQAAHVVADMVALALRAVRLGDGLTAEAVAGAEEERAAVAAMLHDDVLQAMVAVRYASDLAERGLPGALADLRATAADALVSARDTVWSLHPRTASGDLMTALCALTDRLGERGLSLRVAARGCVGQLPPVQAVLCYRLVQEAVKLAAGRLGASRVDAELVRRAGVLRVRITHNGVTVPGAPLEEAPLARWIRRIEGAGGRVGARGGADWLVAEIPPGGVA